MRRRFRVARPRLRSRRCGCGSPAYADARPEIVLHFAAPVGGIGANQKNHGRSFYVDLMMGARVIEERRRVGLEEGLRRTVDGFLTHRDQARLEYSIG